MELDLVRIWLLELVEQFPGISIIEHPTNEFMSFQLQESSLSILRTIKFEELQA